MSKQIVFPRELLLVEVERWHRDLSCGARTRVALTKEEARAYAGYECAGCEAWQKDALSERDIPEWWEELKLTSLDGVKELREEDAAPVEPGEVVKRLSDAWNKLDAGDVGDAEAPEKEEGAGDSI